MSDNKKKIGILNKGKNNKFIDNTFSGLDVGIQDEGEETVASGNKFHQPSKGNKAGDLIIRAGDGGAVGKGGDVHLGPGTFKAGDVLVVNQKSLKEKWYQAWWGQIIIIVASGVAVAIIIRYFGWK